jgi:hypothetical protein
MLALGAGCSADGSVQSDAGSAQTDATPAQTDDSSTQPDADAVQPDDSAAQPNAEKTGSNGNTLGLDLTSFDAVMANDVAHRILNSPQEFLGMTIKMGGHYEIAENYNTGGYIHGVVVCDQILCCEAVLEFIWNGEHVVPDDYPSEFEQIVVEGVLQSYEEAGQT